MKTIKQIIVLWQAGRDFIALLVVAQRGCYAIDSLGQWISEPFGSCWRQNVSGGYSHDQCGSCTRHSTGVLHQAPR